MHSFDLLRTYWVKSFDAKYTAAEHKQDPTYVEVRIIAMLDVVGTDQRRQELALIIRAGDAAQVIERLQKALTLRRLTSRHVELVSPDTAKLIIPR